MAKNESVEIENKDFGLIFYTTGSGQQSCVLFHFLILFSYILLKSMPVFPTPSNILINFYC